MRIDKLYVGQAFKNYKVMCKELEMEVKTSNSKKAQLKELERHCKLQKVGHSISIIEIYETPLTKSENRGRKSVYGDLVQLLIVDYLLEQNERTVLITRNRLLSSISFTNQNYSYGSQNIHYLSRYMDIGSGVIYDFYNTSNASFRSAFIGALENLRSQSLIMYDVVTVVYSNNNHKIASEEQKEFILNIEKETMKSLGHNDIKSVRASRDWETFKKLVSNELEMTSDIKYYYTGYNITVNREHIRDGQKHILEDIINKENRDSKRRELNEIVYNRVMKNAQSRQDKSMETDLFEKGKMHKVRESFSYIEDNKSLANILIKENSRSIVAPIEKLKDRSKKR